MLQPRELVQRHGLPLLVAVLVVREGASRPELVSAALRCAAAPFRGLALACRCDWTMLDATQLPSKPTLPIWGEARGH